MDDNMFGLIVKLTVIPGKRAELIQLLAGSAAKMPGCCSYIVAEDPASENILWVTETWDNRESHDAAPQLRVVQNAMPLIKAMIVQIERIAETHPVWSSANCDS